MTHTPPIPAGNQSPYPLQEPKHDHAPTPPVARRESPTPALGSGAIIGAAVVAGIGAAAVAAAYFFSIRKSATSARKSRRRK